jgi:hypothetical protein
VPRALRARTAVASLTDCCAAVGAARSRAPGGWGGVGGGGGGHLSATPRHARPRRSVLSWAPICRAVDTTPRAATGRWAPLPPKAPAARDPLPRTRDRSQPRLPQSPRTVYRQQNEQRPPPTPRCAPFDQLTSPTNAHTHMLAYSPCRRCGSAAPSQPQILKPPALISKSPIPKARPQKSPIPKVKSHEPVWPQRG